MKLEPAVKKSIYNIIIAVSIGVLLFTVVLILTQVRQLIQQNHHLTELEHQTTQDIKDQTTINQKFFRCLILTPQSAFNNTKTRVAAVDKCVEESVIKENKMNPDNQLPVPNSP